MPENMTPYSDDANNNANAMTFQKKYDDALLALEQTYNALEDILSAIRKNDKEKKLQSLPPDGPSLFGEYLYRSITCTVDATKVLVKMFQNYNNQLNQDTVDLICDNINNINRNLTTVFFDKKATVNAKLQAIENIHFEASVTERYLSGAAKVLSLICVSATAYFVCLFLPAIAASVFAAGMDYALGSSLLYGSFMFGINLALSPTWKIKPYGEKKAHDLKDAISQNRVNLLKEDLKDLKAEPQILTFLQKVMERLDILTKKWWLNNESRAEKSHQIILATGEILDNVRTGRITKLEDLLTYRLKSSALQGKSYQDILHQHRNPRWDSFIGFFKGSPVKTQTEIFLTESMPRTMNDTPGEVVSGAQSIPAA